MARRTAEALSLRALGRATLARQMLLAREAVDVAAAVERLAGMQAQQARPPYVGLWTRLAAFERAALTRAAAAKQVVRATWVRGTLHLVSARDYRTFRAALAPMLEDGARKILRERGAGIDIAAVIAAGRAHVQATPCTFDVLRDALAARFPKVDVRAMGYLVRMHLPLVQVPGDGPWGWPAAADFADAETWLGRTPRAKAAPLAALMRRYLAAFGPATVADAQTWSACTGLREIFDALAPELRTFTGEDGRTYHDLADAPRPAADVEAPVRFLPEFDNLVLAHADRARLVAEAHRPRVVTKNLQVLATFLVDGRVAGTWKIASTRTAATLAIAPFAALSPAAKAALTAEAGPLLRFVEPDVAKHDIRIAKPA